VSRPSGGPCDPPPVASKRPDAGMRPTGPEKRQAASRVPGVLARSDRRPPRPQRFACVASPPQMSIKLRREASAEQFVSSPGADKLHESCPDMRSRLEHENEERPGRACTIRIKGRQNQSAAT